MNATSVDFNRFIVDNEHTRIENIDFGELYFGEKREFKGFLVNNTPK